MFKKTKLVYNTRNKTQTLETSNETSTTVQMRDNTAVESPQMNKQSQTALPTESIVESQMQEHSQTVTTTENMVESQQMQGQGQKSASTETMIKAIAHFQSKIKQGPDFVCLCCHRMMYKQSVVSYAKSRYTKASSELLELVFSADYNHISSDGKQWVCTTCDRTLKMPLQTKSNAMFNTKPVFR